MKPLSIEVTVEYTCQASCSMEEIEDEAVKTIERGYLGAETDSNYLLRDRNVKICTRTSFCANIFLRAPSINLSTR